VKRSIYIGWDPREQVAFEVARHSLLRRMMTPIPVHKLSLADVQARGLYTRPTERHEHLIDVLSKRADYDGSISTEHAIARFCVPELAGEGLALFMDGDVLVRDDITKLFDALDPSRAVHCVQHAHWPKHHAKMDGQVQTRYERKNWSSVMVFNCDHPANRYLGDILNKLPGRDLHAFCWLADSEIGELDPMWNFLVGWSNPRIDPAIVHFTEGLPDMPGYENCAFADDWRIERQRMYDAQPFAAAE